MPRNTHAGLVVASTALIGGSSGNLGGTQFAIIGAVVGALWGAGLVVLARRLSRSEPGRHRWANVTLFATVVAAGLITGVGFLSLLMMDAALNTDPQFFANMIRGSVGDAEALPFFLFNTPLEWVLVPLAFLLTWSDPRCRNLMLIVLVLWTLHRVWTYTYFVPLIDQWGDGAPGSLMTAGEIDSARTWVNLSFIRNAIDLTTMVLALLALLRSAYSRATDVELSAHGPLAAGSRADAVDAARDS
jgi:hypothetical protein